MSHSVRIKKAVELATLRVMELYEVISDGRNLCINQKLNDQLDESWGLFLAQVEKSKTPIELGLIASKSIVTIQNVLCEEAARQGARKSDPKRLAAARHATGRKTLQVADSNDRVRKTYPVF